MVVREDFGRASGFALVGDIVAFLIAAIVLARIQAEDLRSGTRNLISTERPSDEGRRCEWLCLAFFQNGDENETDHFHCACCLDD